MNADADQNAERTPAAGWGPRVLVLSEGENPSLDFFIRPLLASRGIDGAVFDLRAAPPDGAERWDAVVVIRYVTRAWLSFLAAMRRAGKPVAYFMDDDLMDRHAHAGLPLRYRLKIERQACMKRAEIETVCSEFWLSTRYLLDKYAAWKPLQVFPGQPRLAPAPVSVCYHGTASHAAEQEWLAGFVARLQSQCLCTHFTIVGDAQVNRRFRPLPRVTVLQPMSWPSYLSFTSTHRSDIALAPLLPGGFNAARGATKFLDFTRMGAVGLYADVEPYRGVVRHDVDGLLLPMQEDAWLDAITALVDDAPRRQRLAAAAAERLATGPLR